jgi:hypothetical protein
LGFKGTFSGGGQRFLFEILPHRFPFGWLTPVETALWAKQIEHVNELNKAKK